MTSWKRVKNKSSQEMGWLSFPSLNFYIPQSPFFVTPFDLPKEILINTKKNIESHTEFEDTPAFAGQHIYAFAENYFENKNLSKVQNTPQPFVFEKPCQSITSESALVNISS